jgi:hypothetical protein
MQLIEDIARKTLEQVGPEASLLIGIVAVLAVLLPPVYNAYRTLVEIRGGVRKLEIEKARLEVELLRQKLSEQVKPLPDAEPEPQPMPQVQAQPDPKTQEEVGVRPDVPTWLARYPKLSIGLLLVAQIILGYLTVNFAFITIVFIPFAMDPQYDAIEVFVGLVVFVGITWFLYIVVRRLGKLRKRLSLAGEQALADRLAKAQADVEMLRAEQLQYQK